MVRFCFAFPGNAARMLFYRILYQEMLYTLGVDWTEARQSQRSIFWIYTYLFKETTKALSTIY